MRQKEKQNKDKKTRGSERAEIDKNKAK